MRFRFFQPSHEAETSRHLEVLRRIDGFWAAAETCFSSDAGVADADAVGNQLTALVEVVDEGILVEFETLPEGRSRLVLAPRSEAGLDPLVSEVIKRAPRLPRTEVLRYRPPSSADQVLEEVQSRFGFDLSSAEVRAGFGRGHLMEVVVYSPAFPSALDEAALDAANFAVSRLVGEQTFDDWIGAVEVAPMGRSSMLRVLDSSAAAAENRFALEKLRHTVERSVSQVKNELPSAPYHAFCEHAGWTMLELDPEDKQDYSAQDDLALCATMLPEMMKCYLSGERFSSCRFSNYEERFLYLKVDFGDVETEARFDRRLELEEALNVALVPSQVGCVVGAGLGLRYVYVDLAFEKVDAGIAVTRRVLERHGCPERAWLLFCDSIWAREWVGASDKSPPPP